MSALKTGNVLAFLSKRYPFWDNKGGTVEFPPFSVIVKGFFYFKIFGKFTFGGNKNEFKRS